MDSYNRNATRKRKLSQSKERTDQKSAGCFGRCCARKKTDASIEEQAKPPHRPVEKIAIENERANLKTQAAVGAGDKNPSRLKAQLSRSPEYNESTWCGKPLQSEPDPCVECTVQRAPDTWENVPKYLSQSNEQIRGNQQSTFVAPLSTFPEKGINSFVNDVIGDGVDRMSEMATTTTNNRYQQIPPTTDDTSSISPAVHEEDMDRNKGLSSAEKENQSVVLTQSKPSGLVPGSQDLKPKSPSSCQPSVQLSPSIADDYNWNLGLNSVEEKVLTKETAFQNQQSYNWEEEDYSWSSTCLPSEQKPAINNISNNPLQQTVIDGESPHPADDDAIGPSYSIASLPSSDKKQRVQSQGFAEDPKGIPNEPSKSVSYLPQEKTISSTMNVKLAQDQEIPEQNDRFSSTSVSELFKHVMDAKQQKSRDLASISTAYSIPVSMRPSVVPQMNTDQNHAQPSQTNSKRLKNNHIVSPWTYHDLMQSWRYFLQRLVNVILPSTHTAAAQSTTSTSHSWSTSTCAETQNSGPWWGRRDIDDHVPATFIFANEPFSAWYSLDTTPVENTPCCSRDYHCASTCRCCCRSSSL